jgi:dipeptidyl aminopeptidase/acylaminoacyl peptidase
LTSDGIPRLAAGLIADGAVPQQPAISPDGRWVAYVVAPAGRRGDRRLSALWLAAADASSPPVVLTAGTAAESSPRWAPDSTSLFFMSDRAGSAQVYRIRRGGGEAEALTGWRGVICDARPLADGRLVAVVATDEPSADYERRRDERDDAVAWTQRVPVNRLRLLDLGTGELRLVSGLGDRHVVEVVQRPDGGPLAVVSRATPAEDPYASAAELHVVDQETGSVRDLGPVAMEASSPAWWKSGGRTARSRS